MKTITDIFPKMIHQLRIPLFVVILIALAIASQNIDPSKHFAGWDNIHAEFNLGRYARQVLFGAWLEHQGMGAPAAQGHLSEIPRLPILLLLKVILPDNLIRIVFIFAMYLIGGIGMYFYLAKSWLGDKNGDKKLEQIKPWLASMGGIFYLLHILTLQQFYISFEMFAVQFAFLPFLLIAIHHLASSFTTKNILIFLVIQLLIAPSGHTPTVFYLAVLFSLLYAFFLTVKSRGFVRAAIFSFLTGVITLAANFYWIAPNLYYSANNSHYVYENHENQIFGPESIWSVREASTWFRFLTGEHYLFTWKDLDFSQGKYVFIFDEWQDHLAKPLTQVILVSLGVLTIFGALATIRAKEKGATRHAVLICYLITSTFIWIDLFPTKFIYDQFYKSSTFLEMFRNPFTKLSIIYSFVSVLLFVAAIELIVAKIYKKNLAKLVPMALIVAIIVSAWPSFQGHFISEKLQIKFPDEYKQLYEYLSKQDKDLRILQLPQITHAGWEYYDWSFIEEGNGYQGMSFMFFGVPQAMLNRDSDRWVETSDYFYHELKYVLDSKNPELFNKILEKYNIDLVLIDETKLDPYGKHSLGQDYKLISEAGLEKIWSHDFLYLYRKNNPNPESELIIPASITFASAVTDRTKYDTVYQDKGDYILTSEDSADVVYPFSNLLSKETPNINISESGAMVTEPIPQDAKKVIIPAIAGDRHLTPVEIKFENKKVNMVFPKISIDIGETKFKIPQINDLDFAVDTEAQKIAIFFNDQGIVVENGQTAYPVLSLDTNLPIEVGFTDNMAQIENSDQRVVVEPLFVINQDWTRFKKDYKILPKGADKMTILSEFPTAVVDLQHNPSINCSEPNRGEIESTRNGDTVTYYAKNYAVNCNGFAFEYLSAAYSYILNVTGRNIQGRGTKLFINYFDKSIMTEDYVLQDSVFNKNLTIPAVTTDPRQNFILDWETRSFGQTDINELEDMKITPFPLVQLAGIRVERNHDSQPFVNHASVLSHSLIFDSVYIVDVECRSGKCYLGIDQTYDDLWLAFQVGKFSLLPHMRLNNWANIWQYDSGGRVVILYLPEVVASLSFLILVISISLLAIKYYREPKLTKLQILKRNTLHLGQKIRDTMLG